MSGSGEAVDMSGSGVRFRHPTASVVHATESLIEYYEDTDVAFDLHIELKADWNTFFRQVPIAGPSGDDTDGNDVTVDGQDTTGAKYYSFADGAPTGLKLPRDRLEQAMDLNSDRYADINAGTGQFNDTNAEASFWAIAEDSMNATGYGIQNNHMQSVAKGLVGLFSNSDSLGDLTADNLVVVDPSGPLTGTDADDVAAGNVAAADSAFEIRIDQTNLRSWMSPSGEYGANVFKKSQIEELFKAMTDSGRTFMEPTAGDDISDLRKNQAYETASRGMRFLALRQDDCLQVKIIVNDSVGLNSTEYDLLDDARPNHRRWLLSLRQTETGSFDSSQAIGSKYKNIDAAAAP